MFKFRNRKHLKVWAHFPDTSSDKKHEISHFLQQYSFSGIKKVFHLDCIPCFIIIRASMALHFWSNVEFWGKMLNHPCPKWIVFRTNPSLFDLRSTVGTPNHCMHLRRSVVNLICDGRKIKKKCEMSIWRFAHTSRQGASDSELSGNRIPYRFTFGNREFVIFPA